MWGLKSILESRETCRSVWRASVGSRIPLHCLEKQRNPLTSFKKKHVCGLFRLKNTIPQTSQHTQTQKTSIHLKHLKVPPAPTLRSPLRITVSPVIKTAHFIFKIKIKFYIPFKGGEGLSLSSHRGRGGDRIDCKTKFHKTERSEQKSD